MSEFWARTLKIAALLVGAYLLLFLVELSGAGRTGEVERYAREADMTVDSVREYAVLGSTVSVYRLNGDDGSVLAARDRTVGYRSRLTVVAYYGTDGAEPEVIVVESSESAMVDRVLPRRPVPASTLIDALSRATVTAGAIENSLERSRWAIRRFREDRR